MTKLAMRGGLSAHAAMLEMAQEAADQAAVNVLNILVEWVSSKGYPDLAREMLDTFAAEQDGTETPADPLAEPAPAAVQPEADQATPAQAILIAGEHDAP